MRLAAIAGAGCVAAALVAGRGALDGAADPPDPADRLGRAAAAAGFGGTVCPDGWAARQAERLPLTEAELTSWYLREALTRSDSEVLAAAAALLAAPAPPAGLAVEAQIALCVAESRRLIVWPRPAPA